MHKGLAGVSIEGKSDPEEIAGLFMDKFEALYNSVGYDEEEMDYLYRNNESRIESLWMCRGFV